MMTPALQEQLFHKHRKAIRMVRESLEKGSVVTIEGLMQEHGWCRTKAHTTLQTCWLLGILKAENTTPPDEPPSKPAVQS